ncbi:DEAD/DEAH box helicase [Paracoccus sp. MC1862]|uniref:DEAD/DEAH box helicase n=1 Tax=Paracoccus sp. MC1862 TaxID=2760307 RepID=UPI0016013C60|nr:DEAD/DEAH box helicase [Paracoccus sp. MC1862]QQO46159.1 DEAD/DEAH box helicase [Paracoccus sp. MC1862]
MTKFSDLKLDPKVLQAIAEAGYENPTPIQAGAIPPALEGRDVLGIAQTGTGKTAGFVLPMITLLGRGRARARMPRSLVLCPTRELAAQVAENFDTYAKHTRLTKALLIGGVSFGEQDKLIDRGVDVLIATPGRLLDHFERGKLLLTGVQIMVVDEADRMLDMGFIPDIERIFQLTPFTRQTLFFSATMAPEIERITNTFLHAPERIEVARQATASETITQKLVEITPTRRDQSAKQKRELLRALIDAEGESLKNAIIFCNRKTDVDIVAKSLKAHGYDAAPIHGDLDQRVRTATLDGFREGTLRFLVASDVAARGLDIPAVSHVINFDLPSHAEDYVHRIGRTGRAGREGTAISIGTPSDEKYLTAIETLVKQTLPRVPGPEGFQLSDAAQKPPRPASERGNQRGAPTRTRARRSPAREEPAREKAEVIESPVPQEPKAGSAGESRKPAGNGAREEREDRGRDRRDERREPAREERRDDRRPRDRGPAVTGMGDHTPDFLLTSFNDALVVTEARMTSAAQRHEDAPREQASAAESDGQDAAASGKADGNGEAETTAPSKRTRSRRSRSGRAVKEQAADDQALDAVVESAEPVEAVDDAGAEAAVPKIAVEGEVAADAPAQDAPSEAAQPEGDAEAPPAKAKPAKQAKLAAKPRATRSRRKPAKADPSVEEAGAAEAPQPEAPAGSSETPAAEEGRDAGSGEVTALNIDEAANPPDIGSAPEASADSRDARAEQEDGYPDAAAGVPMEGSARADIDQEGDAAASGLQTVQGDQPEPDADQTEADRVSDSAPQA